jgi:uncharacterized protein (DUF2141 family)
MLEKGLAILLIFWTAVAAGAESSPEPAADTLAAQAAICVEVEGLRNDRGDVKIALFQKSEGFPGRPEKALRRLTVPVVDKHARGEFSGIPAGEYAVSVIHDENKSGTLDTNFYGMPLEGVGVSNNVQGRFGPPSFNDARFQQGTGEQTLKIRIKYLFDSKG